MSNDTVSQVCSLVSFPNGHLALWQIRVSEFLQRCIPTYILLLFFLVTIIPPWKTASPICHAQASPFHRNALFSACFIFSSTLASIYVGIYRGESFVRKSLVRRLNVGKRTWIFHVFVIPLDYKMRIKKKQNCTSFERKPHFKTRVHREDIRITFSCKFLFLVGDIWVIINQLSQIYWVIYNEVKGNSFELRNFGNNVTIVNESALTGLNDTVRVTWNRYFQWVRGINRINRWILNSHRIFHGLFDTIIAEVISANSKWDFSVLIQPQVLEWGEV